MKNGQIRRNPKRTQIDYILTNKKYLRFVTDSRSYNNLHTNTDHNMVIMNMNLELSRLTKPKKAHNPQINTDNLNYKEYVTNYRQKVTESNNEDNTECKTNDESWEKIIKNCEEAGKEILGIKEKYKQKQEDEEIGKLKDTRQRLKVNISGCNSQEVRKKFEEERKGLQKKIKSKLKENEERDLDIKMKNLEAIKNDNTKYYYVMRSLQNSNRNTKSSILVKDKEGNTPGSNEDKSH